MEKTINERFRLIITERKISANYLAKIANISQTTISRQIKGDYNVSIESIYAVLHECPDVSPDWLLMGTGPKYRLPELTGNESDEMLDLHAEIAKLTAERDAAIDNLRRAEERINELKYTIELQKNMLHKSHEDYFEEKRKSV